MGGVMKHSSCFQITTHPEVFYSSYARVMFSFIKKTTECTFYLFIVCWEKNDPCYIVKSLTTTKPLLKENVTILFCL